MPPAKSSMPKLLTWLELHARENFRLPTTRISDPQEFHACAESAANSGLLHRHNVLCNWANVSQFLRPGEMRTPGLAFRATVERARVLPRLGIPTVARRSARLPLHLRPIRARHGVDFQKRPQRRRNRADSLHPTVAALAFSRGADDSEQAAAVTQLAAPGRITFARAAVASDKEPASSGKAGAILHGRQDRQSAAHRCRSQSRALGPPFPWPLHTRRERH